MSLLADTGRGGDVLLANVNAMTWLFLPTFVNSIISTWEAMHCTSGNCAANAESGRHRMTQELKEAGLSVGHCRVDRLMRENGICIVRTRKYKRTTDSNHTFNIAPNLLDRDFYADRPNQKWIGDISYIWTREGWLYLAVMIDLHSRRVVALSAMQASLAG